MGDLTPIHRSINVDIYSVNVSTVIGCKDTALEFSGMKYVSLNVSIRYVFDMYVRGKKLSSGASSLIVLMYSNRVPVFECGVNA